MILIEFDGLRILSAGGFNNQDFVPNRGDISKLLGQGA